VPLRDLVPFGLGRNQPHHRDDGLGPVKWAMGAVLKMACSCAGYLLLVAVLAPQVPAVELKKETVAAFERYVQLTEARIQAELKGQHTFLWMDGMTGPRREAVYAQLRQGQIVIERLETFENGKEIDMPGGQMHHWLAAVFIPGTTLKETLILIKDYDRHHSIYKPEVLQSKLLSHNGNNYKIFLRVWKKKIITVVMNTEHEVRYFPVSATREHSRSYTTRIAEVEDPDEPTEKEKPVGNDGGFLWRLYSYWRFEEKDGGVYVQCEALSLTRSVPLVLRPLVNPFITGIPKESLMNTLTSTRTALLKRPAAVLRAPAPARTIAIAEEGRVHCWSCP
jgi:L-rhamnose mutarotase